METVNRNYSQRNSLNETNIKYSLEEGIGTIYHLQKKSVIRDLWLTKSLTFNISDKIFDINYDDNTVASLQPFSESLFFGDLFELPLQKKSINEHIGSLKTKLLNKSYQIKSSLISTLVRLLRSRVLICSCNNNIGIDKKNCYAMFIRDLSQETLDLVIAREVKDTRTKCKDCGNHTKNLRFCRKCKNFTCSRCVTICKSCNKIYCMKGSHTSSSCKKFMTLCSKCPELFCRKCCNIHEIEKHNIDHTNDSFNRKINKKNDNETFPTEKIEDWCI